MTDHESLRRAINDARALLETMTRNELARLHVSSGGVEIFMSRHKESSPLSIVAEEPTASPQRSFVEHRVTAPHVATLVRSPAIGTRVNAGASVATIAVLDEAQDLISPVTGRVSLLEAAEGDLIEYGQTVLVIEVAA